ncbi:MAG: DoxX family membrane protein [Actinobacteria bacterium]|nr:DoxX family membrane protein [Actinomycetota bacterium]
MRATSARGLVHLALRLIPAALLLWAGLAKAFDRQEAILAVSAYDVLPSTAAEIVGTVLPWIEIGVGLLLALGLFTRVAGAATAALALDCGCFGGGGPGDGVSWWDIARDVPILLAGGFLALRPQGPLQLDSYFREEADEPGVEAHPSVQG